jgi:hypothetical protein
VSLRDYLNSLPPERREEARREFDAIPEPEGRLEDLFEQAAYERSVALDPSGERVSRVVLRLHGDTTVDASLDDTTAEQVIGAFGREVRAAAGEGAADAKLRLVGFSAGSVILHFEPARPEIEQAADGALRVWSVADHAIQNVLELHRAIESQRPAAEIQNRFAQPGLLNAARRFFDVLDKENLDMAARWYGPTGALSVSSITFVGRRYAIDNLFAKDEKEENEVLSGMVNALSIDGVVTIRAGHRKPDFKVPAEMITDGSFVIGEFTQVLARKTYRADKVGLLGDPSYEFIDFAFVDGDTSLLDEE